MLAGKELDQEKILRQKLQKEQESEFARALQHEKEKSIKLQKDYEKQLENMKRAHSQQCEELAREILKVTLEADRLHNQLVGTPRQTRLFSKGNPWKDLPIRSILVSICFAVSKFYIAWMSSVNRSLTLHLDVILQSCSPLRDTKVTFSSKRLYALQ